MFGETQLEKRARDLAEDIYKGDWWDRGISRMEHARHVAEIIEDFGGGMEEVAAGYLHDATRVSATAADVILDAFGSRTGSVILSYVYKHTGPPEWKALGAGERLRMLSQSIRFARREPKRVILACHLATLRHIVAGSPTNRPAKDREEYVIGCRTLYFSCLPQERDTNDRGYKLLMMEFWETWEKARAEVAKPAQQS